MRTAKSKIHEQPEEEYKPITPYVAFVQEQRGNVLKADSQLSVKEIVAHLAKQWQGLSDEQRTPYIERAIEDQARHEQEQAALVAGPPKKPMNPYMLFAQDQRQNVKLANPGLAIRDVVRHLGTLWKGLSDEQKAPYEVRAEQAKLVHADERTKWLDQCKELGISPKKKPTKDKKKLKAGKKARKEAMGPRPKRPQPAFMYFSVANRPAVSAQNPAWKLGDVSKELGRLWREMDAEAKGKFFIMHEHDKERFRVEMENFVPPEPVGGAEETPFKPKSENGTDDDDLSAMQHDHEHDHEQHLHGDSGHHQQLHLPRVLEMPYAPYNERQKSMALEAHQSLDSDTRLPFPPSTSSLGSNTIRHHDLQNMTQTQTPQANVTGGMVTAFASPDRDSQSFASSDRETHSSPQMTLFSSQGPHSTEQGAQVLRQMHSYDNRGSESHSTPHAHAHVHASSHGHGDRQYEEQDQDQHHMDSGLHHRMTHTQQTHQSHHSHQSHQSHHTTVEQQAVQHEQQQQQLPSSQCSSSPVSSTDTNMME